MAMCIGLTIITGIVVCIDISRHHSPKIKRMIVKYMHFCLRENEINGHLKLTGASYMMMGLLLSGVLFSKGLAITAWLILIISDCIAAIIGTKFGLPLALFNGKSLIGSLFFFISAIFVSIITYFAIGYSTSFAIIILSSFLTTLAEFFAPKLRINDNFLIPITYSLSTILFGLVV
ncbi:MAG: hypothetical protein AB8B66_01375 [Rickettsiaceae bacterium]